MLIALLVLCSSSFIQFVDLNTPNSLIENFSIENPFLKLNNQNINITTPENKTYTKSMDGYYPATYGFECDENNKFPKGWYENSGANGYAKVVNGIGGHNKVLECYSNSSDDSRVDSIIFFDPQEQGSVEFWWYKSSSYTSAAIVDFWGETPGMCISIRVDHWEAPSQNKVEYQSGGGYLDTGYSYYTDDKWMHIRIDFDCSSDTYSLWIDQVLYLENIDFINSKDETGINQMRFDSYNAGNAVLYYVDAVGFSWDPNYDISNNFHEGLLLSFTNSTTLDWIGYSLDGQPDKTIFGNITIPIPEEGIHTIQVHGNDTLEVPHNSAIRYFSVDLPIDIITPEDKTYEAPMSGYYPATFGFENTKNESIPEGWWFWTSDPSGDAESFVLNEVDGHKKVIKYKHGGTTGTGTQLDSPTFTQQVSVGTLEWWMYYEDNGLNHDAHLFVGDYLKPGSGFRAAIVGLKGDGSVMYNDASLQLFHGVGTYDLDTWHHFKLDFDCFIDKYNLTVDGTIIASNMGFIDDLDYLQYLRIGSDTLSNCSAYYDAFGFSWEPGYNLGDNLKEGLLLSFTNETALDWIGYSLDNQPKKVIRGNTTLQMPSDGDHTIQLFGNDTFGTNYESDIRQFSVYHINITTPENKTYYEPMSGYYPATYGFENDIIGASPQDWNKISEADRKTTVEEIYDDHRHVLKMWDNTASIELTTRNNFQSQLTGKVEFWWAVGDINDQFSMLLVDPDWGVVFSIRDGYFKYRDSSIYHTISGAPIPQINRWYHIRIDFRCNEAPAYEGLSENRYFVYIDGAKYGEFPFVNNMNSINQSAFSIGIGSMQTTYVDAIGYSWDLNYEIGDNLNEGLLLSYENSTALDWQGYSLDGLPNNTIMGNTTIPLPDIGQHTIQIFANDSLGLNYYSDIRYFTIRSPISIITPENTTYTEPMSGYYPGTYGFENDADGTSPEGWINQDWSGCTSEIISELGGHKKVLRQTDNSPGYGAVVNRTFTSAQDHGTVEFYARVSLITPGTRMWLDLNSASGQEIWLIMDNSGIKFWDGGPWYDIIPSGITANTWYHFSIRWRNTGAPSYEALGEGEWKVFIDEVEYGNYNLSYDDNMISVNLESGAAPSGHITYWDAVGFDWDPNYNIGDNLKEGLLLSFENYTSLNWTGFSLNDQSINPILGNTTFTMPFNGLYTIQVYGNNSMGTSYESDVRYFSVNFFSDLSISTPENKTYTEPMSGYYPATFGFEDDKGKTDTSISFVDGIESGSNIVNVSEELDGHKDYLDYQDDNYFYNNFSSQTIGYIDFWFRTETLDSMLGDQLWISVRDSAKDALTLQFYNGEIRSLEDGTWSPSPGWYFYSTDTWYHISILFNCSSETYSVWINNVLIRSEKDFAYSSTYDYSAGVEELRFDGFYSPVRRYFDAIGYSWESNYNVNDNLNEGLFLSYGKNTNLDWQGYSLDGQPIKTILGNTTIPMPGDGNYSIQVFANDSLGFNYLSNIRYFAVSITITIDITNPVIIINSPSFNDLFGSSTPFFNLTIIEPNLKSMWHTLDGGLTNTTISGQSGMIDQTIWINVPDGTTIIRFYANDEAGNIGFAEVNVRKDTLAPEITINTPSVNGIFPEIAPNFDLSILEGNLDSIWYTLDGGITNTISPLPTATIDQTVWESYSNGTVTIKFYANDTFGKIGFEEITIRKDVLAPVITIINPEEGGSFGESAPFFEFTIFEGNLDSGTIRYTIDDSPFSIPSNTSGQLSQQLWNALPPGSYIITFYASDVVGNEGFSRVIINKSGPQIIYGYDNLLLSLMLIMGILSIAWQIRKKIKKI